MKTLIKTLIKRSQINDDAGMFLVDEKTEPNMLCDDYSQNYPKTIYADFTVFDSIEVRCKHYYSDFFL